MTGVQNMDFENKQTSFTDYELIENWMNVGMVQLLVTHPLIVLRRQCQVNSSCQKLHLLPFTLVPVVFKLTETQGIVALWKGLYAVVVVKAISFSLEYFLSWSLGLTKEGKYYSWTTYGKHVLVKCITLSVMTPWYSVSLAETVESHIVWQRTGIFDMLKQGLTRFVRVRTTNQGRMLSVYTLLGPTVLCGFLKHSIAEFIYSIMSFILKFKELWKQQAEMRYCIVEEDLNSSSIQEIEKNSSLVGFFTAEILMYPLETILNRLHLQGTRTIIDNLETGSEVIPILTNYQDVTDCYDTILREETVLSFYKGFGALILQILTNIVLLRFVSSRRRTEPTIQVNSEGQNLPN